MELVTGYTGEPHITPEQDADLYRGIIGIDSYVLPVGRQLEHEVETVNKIVVNDGVLMLQGREMSIEAGHQDEYTIENGIQGENRIDLIGIRYTVDPDTGKESVTHETIKGKSVAGNPTDPTFTTGDIRGEGAIDVFFALYSVRLTGLTISAVVKRFAVTQSVTDLEEYIDAQKGRIDTLNASLKVSTRGMTGGTLDINVATYGKLRQIRASGYTKKEMASGTTYTINQTIENYLHSVVRRYTLNSTTDFALSIGTDGLIQLTPTATIPVNTAINFSEFLIVNES